MDYIHASKDLLSPGTQLKPNYRTGQVDQARHALMTSALAEGAKVAKVLLLSDYLIATYTKQRDMLPSIFTEVIFEDVRMSQFAERPGRIGAGVFLSPSRTAAVKCQKLLGGRPHLFVCEIRGPSSIKFDMAFLNVPLTAILGPIEEYIDDLKQRALRYWKGDRSDKPILEVIATGTVIVKKQIS